MAKLWISLTSSCNTYHFPRSPLQIPARSGSALLMRSVIAARDTAQLQSQERNGVTLLLPHCKENANYELHIIFSRRWIDIYFFAGSEGSWFLCHCILQTVQHRLIKKKTHWESKAKKKAQIPSSWPLSSSQDMPPCMSENRYDTDLMRQLLLDSTTALLTLLRNCIIIHLLD